MFLCIDKMAIELGPVRAGERVVIDTRKGTAKIVTPTGAVRREVRKEPGKPQVTLKPEVKEKEVPYKVGAKPAPKAPPITEKKPIYIKPQRVPSKLELEAAKFAMYPFPAYIGRKIAERGVTPKEIKAIARETGEAVKAIPAGVAGVATFPIAKFVGTGEYTNGRRLTLEEQQAIAFKKAPIGGKVGYVSGAAMGWPVIAPRAPGVKGITPTTREIKVTKVDPTGKFEARAVIEAGEKYHPVIIKGEAVRVPGAPVTLAKGKAAVLIKPTKAVGYKFRAVDIKTIEFIQPKKEVSLAFGKVTKVGKPTIRWFKGVGVTKPISPTEAMAKTGIEVFKEQAKVSEAFGVGLIKQVKPTLPTYYLKAPKGVGVLPKPAIKQITKGIVETVKTTIPTRMGLGIIAPPVIPKIMPRAKPTVKPTIAPKVAPAIKEAIKPVTTTVPKIAPVTKTRVIPAITPREIAREKVAITPVEKPITIPITKITPIQKIKPIQTPIAKTRPVSRTTMPFVPVYPMLDIPKTPFATPLALPPVAPLAFFKTKGKPKLGKKQKKRYKPSLTGLAEGLYIKKPPIGKLTGLEIRPLLR